MAKNIKQVEELPKLSKDDPALKALNAIAAALDHLSREEQLKTLAAACSQLGMVDYAMEFLTALKRDQRRIV